MYLASNDRLCFGSGSGAKIIEPSTKIKLSSGVLSTSTRRLRPSGTNTDSISIGANSPPHVVSLDHALAYLKTKPWVAAKFPSMLISNEVGINPGLSPVVQLTYVGLAPLTGQLTPSIVILILEASLGKLIPVNVIGVPPVTVPYLGLMASSLAVSSVEYVTLFTTLVIYYPLFSETWTLQE